MRASIYSQRFSSLTAQVSGPDVVGDSENGASNERRFCCPLGNLMYCYDRLVSDAAAAAAAPITTSSPALLSRVCIDARAIVLQWSQCLPLDLIRELIDVQA